MSTSLVAVFIPLLFMGGLIGRLFHEFAVTVTLAILVSGVISLTLTPMLCSRFLKPESAYRTPGPFIRACEASFNWLLRHYETGLRWVLRHWVFMLGVWLLTLVATFMLYRVVPKGFFPQQDTGIIFGTTDASQDISFAAMKQLQMRVDEDRPRRPGGGHAWRRSSAAASAVRPLTTAACSSPSSRGASGMPAPTRSSTGCAESSRASPASPSFCRPRRTSASADA